MALPIAYNIRSLFVRWKSTLLAMTGIALVVAVFVGLLSMASGLGSMFRGTGSDQNGIVMQRGSQSELGSSITKDAVEWIATDPRVARGADGKPLVSPELVTVIALPDRVNGNLKSVTIRGVTPEAFNVHAIRLLQGRRVTPGLFEILVGRQVQNRIRGLNTGDRVLFMKQEFEVVGVFDADGASFESEIWSDLDAMASAAKRQGTANSLTVRLTDPATLPSFDRDIRANPQFQLFVRSEREWYEEQAGPLTKFLKALAAFVSVVMGIGAVFGAMNTMYAMVASRTREIGTLRALGFSRSTILLSFVLEGLFLAVAGGVLGCLLSFGMEGLKATTSQNMADVVFGFRVTLADIGYGILFAAIMGIVGSFLPALRAARLPVTVALREG